MFEALYMLYNQIHCLLALSFGIVIINNIIIALLKCLYLAVNRNPGDWKTNIFGKFFFDFRS